MPPGIYILGMARVHRWDARHEEADTAAQTHIDTIVATTPSTPTQQGQGQGSSSGSGSASSSAPSTARARVIPVPMKMPLASAAHGGLQNSYHAGAPLPQHAQTSQQQQQQHPQQPPPPPPAPLLQSAPFPTRRPKIYCDKWVHEGVCAFTQQGCKYKHEMPLDKVTQHQLGLFHGLPAWWKKHQAELARQREPAGGAGEPEPRLVGEGAGRASNVAVPHHHLHHVHQGGGGPGPMGGAAGTGVLGARGGRSAAGSSVLGDNHHSHNNSNNSNNNTMPWRRATGPAVADRNSTGPHHPQLGQPLSPHRLGTGGRHPTMVSSNLITSRGASLGEFGLPFIIPLVPPLPPTSSFGVFLFQQDTDDEKKPQRPGTSLPTAPSRPRRRPRTPPWSCRRAPWPRTTPTPRSRPWTRTPTGTRRARVETSPPFGAAHTPILLPPFLLILFSYCIHLSVFVIFPSWTPFKKTTKHDYCGAG